MSVSQAHVSGAVRNSREPRRRCFPSLFSAADPCDVIARAFLLCFCFCSGARRSNFVCKERAALVNKPRLDRGFLEAPVIAPVARW